MRDNHKSDSVLKDLCSIFSSTSLDYVRVPGYPCYFPAIRLERIMFAGFTLPLVLLQN